MKFEEVQCIKCGKTFIRTNPTNKYCEGKCRVAAHREKQGNQKPIFDKDQASLVEQIAQISLEDFKQLIQDAIRYRTFFKLYEKEKYIDFDRNTLFQEAFEKIEEEEIENGFLYKRSSNSVKFIQPVTEFLEKNRLKYEIYYDR